MAKKLTQFILIALVLGIITGLALHYAIDDGTPASEAKLKSIAEYLSIVTTLFLRLIKMIIAPLVFATLVAGIAHMGDLAALGRVAEHSAFKMHAVGLGAEPPIVYWRSATLDCIQRVWSLRADGLAAWVTMDAGPQVKVLCDAAGAERVRVALAELPGVERVIACKLGQGATVVT